MIRSCNIIHLSPIQYKLSGEAYDTCPEKLLPMEVPYQKVS